MRTTVLQFTREIGQMPSFCSSTAQAYRSWLRGLDGRCVVSHLGEYMVSVRAWLLAGSVVLEYVPTKRQAPVQ